MLPQGPVADEVQRSSWELASSQVDYQQGQPAVSFPVLPVMAFGAAYDLDLVIVSKHPEWNMHEYARVRTPSGPVWLAKDAREGSLDQSIVANVADLHQWLPEIPLERKFWPLEVIDRSTEEHLDLQLRYENLDGELVEVAYKGPVPKTAQKKRNGSTLGHSKNQAIAVLDLPLRDFGRRASIQIAGKKVALKRLLGLVPFRMALVQTQGGLVVGTFSQVENSEDGASEGFQTRHRMPSGSHEVLQSWRLEASDDVVDAIQEVDFRTLSYRFFKRQSYLELSSITITQFQREHPALEVSFYPPLPDLRQPFEGEVRSRFVIDVNGQRNHATGWASAHWQGEQVLIDWRPLEPWWTVDRPMQTVISFGEEGAVVSTRRVEP